MTARLSLAELPATFDAIIIGGGITGAGVLNAAVRTNAKVLLVEQSDFASGTSSWSSKLVHGGLRYLKSGQWRLTLESVRERQRLMQEAPGLVEPLTFLMPIYRGRKPGRWLMRVGLWVYDWMAGAHRSGWLNATSLLKQVPQLGQPDLIGAVHYEDAKTDDARLVLRLILEAQQRGGYALNYTRAEVLHDAQRVTGVRLTDAVSGDTREIAAGVVINASGAWAGTLPGAPSGAPTLRPLRGSHLVFTTDKLPLQQAVSWLHPRDARPVFAYPWEGVTVYGTTDLDHDGALDAPTMTSGEVAYLIEGLTVQFPDLRLRGEDALCVYSGVRPIVSSGKDDPSAESRESAMWSGAGWVSITGGKLTTFRVTAREVLKAAAQQVPALKPAADETVFAHEATSSSRLQGRLGAAADALLKQLPEEAQEPVLNTPYAWAELRWALHHEQVVHLSDLLMRRTRIGLVAEQGGRALLPRLETMCREALGWDESRWQTEVRDYLAYWQRQHAVPRT